MKMAIGAAATVCKCGRTNMVNKELRIKRGVTYTSWVCYSCGRERRADETIVETTK
ncbi:MAG: hypothetical protein HYY29_03835 [Chloroflexi bacterium]|nr:hypothetical protein [Chloroflexota bacterium]